MIFTRISYRIALQFTAFVFGLFLINGALFLVADINNARHQTESRLTQTAQSVLNLAQAYPLTNLPLPPVIRDRVRVLDLLGRPLLTGGLFTDIPFSPKNGVHRFEIDHDQYRVLTSTILQNGQPIGYIQVADREGLQYGDLPVRVMLYLLGSLAVSGLTFLIGLSFARSSLKPAEEMVERLEQFTQDASHELRTPLAALNSSLDLALRNEKYREGILSAKEDLQDVSVLVERLLELARLDKLVVQQETVDLSGLVQDAVERHRPYAAEQGVTLTSDITEKISVKGDAALLRQVIGNLLSNAIKFRRPTGAIVKVRLTKNKLTVEDNGIGIAPESIPHIFQRFYQAEGSRTEEGFGLGLALVKRIVDLHKWKISARSSQGEGTTFTVGFS